MDFKILCIDDEPKWVDSIRSEIMEHLESLDFTPEFIQKQNGSEIDNFIYRPDIDLMLIDYNLHAGRGDQLINYILEKGSFVEIVFYSADPQIIHTALGGHVAQVHCMHRDDVLDNVLVLCTYSKQRYKDLNVMRGLVLAESIEVEVLLENIMVKTFGSMGDYFRESVLNQGTFDFMSKYKFVNRYFKNKYKQLTDAYSSGGKKDEDIKKVFTYISDIIAKIKPFTDEVIKPRNVVAHGRKIINSNGTMTIEALDKGSDNIDFSKEWVMDRRVIFSKYRALFKDVLARDI